MQIHRTLAIAAMALALTQSAGQTAKGSAMTFLETPQSSRLVAAGGMHVTCGVGSSSMVFHNPACIADTIDGRIDLSIAPVTEGIKFASGAYTHNVSGIGTLTCGLLYAGYGDFIRADEDGQELGTFTANEWALYLSYSRQMTPWLRLGATLKPIFSHLEDDSSFGIAMDFGANGTFADGRFQTGLTIRNAGGVLKKFTTGGIRGKLPFDVQLGLSYKAEHAPFRFYLTLKDLTEWNLSPNSDKLHWGDNLMRHTLIGLEFSPVKVFYFAVGYDQRKRRELTASEAGGMAGFSWGAGIRVAKIDIQYAHNRYHAAGSLNTITISANWRRLTGR